LKQILRIAVLLTVACAALAAFSNVAQAQRVDAAFGISTLLAPSASTANSSQFPQSLSGGAFPGFTGDVVFWHNFGLGAEAFWRGSQGAGNYSAEDGVNYRPVLYNFNGVYSPKLASRIYLELVGGIGAMSTHFYYCDDCQQFGGSQEVASSRHFDVDIGGGVKFYPKGSFFVRPEARFYWVNNDTNYAGSYATRVGVSVGYTFGGK
jgi:hypothetical protein